MGFVIIELPLEGEPPGYTWPFGRPRCLYIITLTFIPDIIKFSFFPSYLRGMVIRIKSNFSGVDPVGLDTGDRQCGRLTMSEAYNF